jgi:hypothetical protein
VRWGERVTAAGGVWIEAFSLADVQVAHAYILTL